MHSITRSVISCPVLIIISCILYARMPSSGTRFIFENTASIKNTHATKFILLCFFKYFTHSPYPNACPMTTHCHCGQEFCLFIKHCNNIIFAFWIFVFLYISKNRTLSNELMTQTFPLAYCISNETFLAFTFGLLYLVHDQSQVFSLTF